VWERERERRRRRRRERGRLGERETDKATEGGLIITKDSVQQQQGAVCFRWKDFLTLWMSIAAFLFVFFFLICFFVFLMLFVESSDANGNAAAQMSL